MVVADGLRAHVERHHVRHHARHVCPLGTQPNGDSARANKRSERPSGPFKTRSKL